MRRMMILGVLVAGLAACGGAEEPEAAGETEPVVAEAKPAADPEQAAPDPAETAREEAEAFVRAL